MNMIKKAFFQQTLDKKVLVIGASVIDMILEVEELPVSGGDATATSTEQVVGGCAFNVAAVLKNLDVDFDFLTPVGKGTYSNVIRAALQEKGITTVVEDNVSDNGWNLSFVEATKERTFVTVPGIETKWKNEWFDGVDVNNYDYIYVCGYELEGPSGQIIVEALKEKKETCELIFDPSPRITFIEQGVVETILEMNPIITVNEDEVVAMTNTVTVEEAIEVLATKVRKEMVVRVGSKGSYVYENNQLHHIPSFPTTVVDTIGAGDSHIGGTIAGLVKGLSIQESVLLGNKVASMVVSRKGGSNPPSKNELFCNK